SRRLDLDRPAPRAEDAGGLGPEEAVPAPLLTPLDALEEEAVRAAMDLEEGRDGRLEVGEDLAADGDQVALAGELPEVGARRRRRPGAERRPSGGPEVHSDATKACSTPPRREPTAAWGSRRGPAGVRSCRSRAAGPPRAPGARLRVPWSRHSSPAPAPPRARWSLHPWRALRRRSHVGWLPSPRSQARPHARKSRRPWPEPPARRPVVPPFGRRPACRR